MLKALVFICAVGSNFCGDITARVALEVPGRFASPVTCAMQGQAYFAQSALSRLLGPDEYVRVVCRPEKRQ